MWWHEKVLGASADGVIHCLNTPVGYEIQYFSASDLDPITKVQEETFYQFVKDSIQNWGVLFNPVIVHPLTLEDWKKELSMDKNQTPPKKRENDLHLRVQCGCNRFYAVKDLGYTVLPCVVEPDLQKAQDLAHVLRCDKRWQRGSNMQDLINARVQSNN